MGINEDIETVLDVVQDGFNKEAERMAKGKKEWKIGEIKTFVVKKGVQETFLPLKEGELYFTIKLDEEGFIDLEDQVEAEMLAHLVRIENKLDKLLKEGENGKKKDV